LSPDPIREREREKSTGGGTRRAPSGGGICRLAELTQELPRAAADSLQGRAVDSSGLAIASERLDTATDVGIPRAAGTTKEVPLRKERGDVRRERQAADLARTQQHVRQARMRAETRHLTAMSGDAAFGGQRSETRQQIARAREHRGGWRIEPLERGRIAGSPAGKLEGERRQVRLDDLRRAEWREAALRALAPGAVAHARLRPSRSALPLLRRGAGNALRLETAHARCRIEALAASETRVHDDPYPRNGQTRLRDVGREDDTSRPRAGGHQRRLLVLARELPIERQDLQSVRAGARRQRSLEQRAHAVNLPRS